LNEFATSFGSVGRCACVLKPRPVPRELILHAYEYVVCGQHRSITRGIQDTLNENQWGVAAEPDYNPHHHGLWVLWGRHKTLIRILSSRGPSPPVIIESTEPALVADGNITRPVDRPLDRIAAEINSFLVLCHG
jgi:hypothetical protein